MIFNASDSSGLLMDLFNFILLFYGLYCFYAWYQLRDGVIPERFNLLGRGLEPKKCLDQEYYVSYMRPRLLVFAVITTVSGVLAVLDAQFGLFKALLSESAATAASLIIGSLLPFALVVWFGACLYKVQKELWP